MVAVDGSRIVGFARAVCDECFQSGDISMVGVAADKRGQGIGSELVRQLDEKGCRNHLGITFQAPEQRGFGREWDSSPQRLRWKESELELKSDRTSAVDAEEVQVK